MDHQGMGDRQPSRANGAARRGLLRGLAAGATTIALGRFAGGETSAKPKRAKQTVCKRCPKLCDSRDLAFCRATSDIAKEACVCARNASGGTSCVDIHDGLGCSATNQCLRDADCAAGHACITVDAAHCCPPPADGQPAPTGNLCKPVCKPGK